MHNRTYIFAALTCLFALNNVIAAPFDTGYLTWTQPNGVIFTARLWGDEWFFWMETQDGYRIVKTDADWYSYASLDSLGEFAATSSHVGIDSPVVGSYHLERSAARITAIKQMMQSFQQSSLSKQSAGYAVSHSLSTTIQTIHVGIILVQFSDVELHGHYAPGNGPRPDGYKTADFENAFFSVDSGWYKPHPILGDPSPHPEGDPVFGSFRDYWYQMSLGNLSITGRVVNPTDSLTGLPTWITLDNSYAYYFNQSLARALADDAMAMAAQLGYTSSIAGQPNYFDKFIIVYAGDSQFSGSLRTYAYDINGPATWCGERIGQSIYGPFAMAFLHWGPLAHEFGHLIGFVEQYASGDPASTSTANYDLMANGLYNGPELKGECPSTLNPEYRVAMGWVSPHEITSDEVNQIVEYNYLDPKLFILRPVAAPGDEHYLLESRGRAGFDLYTPDPPGDSVYQAGTLLVWHNEVVRTQCPAPPADPGPPCTDFSSIVFADGQQTWDPDWSDDFFPTSFVPGRQSLNDLTTPVAILGGVGDNARLAHFALNGIHRLANNNTQIDTISLHLTMASGTLASNTTWSDSVLIVDDVTLVAGTTLTISPGSKIMFSSGKALRINGQLNASGTSSQPIIFTSSSASPQRGDWYGIVITNNANTNYPSTINYCDVSYATYGFLINTGWNVTLDHVSIQNSSNYAIAVNNTYTTTATVSVTHSTLSNNAAPVSVQNGDLKLLSFTQASNNDWGAVLWTNGKLHMGNSSITDNGNYGIYVNGAGSYAVLSPDGYSPGNNYVTNNSGGQVFDNGASGGTFLGQRVTTTTCICDTGGGGIGSVVGGSGGKLSSRDFSVQTGGGGGGGGGCNYPCYLQTNTYEAAGYNYIDGAYYWVRTPTSIKAELNYWGACPYVDPTTVPGAFYGTIDVANWQTVSDCGGPVAVFQPVGNSEESSANSTFKASARQFTTMSDVVEAPDSVLLKWVGVLRRNIVSHPEDPEMAGTLKLLATFAGPGGRFQQLFSSYWDQFLLSLVGNTASCDQLIRTAQILLLQDRFSTKDYSGLLQRANVILSANPSDAYWMNVQEYILLSQLSQGDVAGAKATYQAIQSRASNVNPRMVAHFRELLNLADAGLYGAPAQSYEGAGGQDVTGQPSGNSSVVPSVYSLGQNYPNPFNPSTRIEYSLQFDGHARLSILNLLGQEVAKLVDEFQVAGSYHLSFDASHLPSGLYFYRLQAGNFVDTKKMLLVK